MIDERVNNRLLLRNYLNDYLLEVDKLIDIANELRKNRRKKEADMLIQQIDNLLDNYGALDTAASDIDSEITK